MLLSPARVSGGGAGTPRAPSQGGLFPPGTHPRAPAPPFLPPWWDLHPCSWLRESWDKPAAERGWLLRGGCSRARAEWLGRGHRLLLSPFLTLANDRLGRGGALSPPPGPVVHYPLPLFKPEKGKSGKGLGFPPGCSRAGVPFGPGRPRRGGRILLAGAEPKLEAGGC